MKLYGWKKNAWIADKVYYLNFQKVEYAFLMVLRALQTLPQVVYIWNF